MIKRYIISLIKGYRARIKKLKVYDAFENIEVINELQNVITDLEKLLAFVSSMDGNEITIMMDGEEIARVLQKAAQEVPVQEQPKINTEILINLLVQSFGKAVEEALHKPFE